VSHYYNSSAARNGGLVDVVVNGKHIEKTHVGSFVEDIERGVANGIRPEPWQTDTCIGDWHYSRELAEKNGYKTVSQVVGMLVDVVSKNGNLMLNIPVRGNGTIDEHEVAFLEGLAAWMGVNGEGIFSTRPWKTFGEGPTRLSGRESKTAYTSQDVRFTAKGGTLYAFVLAWPESRTAQIKTLAANSPELSGRKVAGVSLLGYDGRLEWSQGEQGLTVKLPEKAPSDYAVTLKIDGIA